MLTKKVLESLVYAGAFDSLGYARGALIQTHEKVSVPIAAERKAEAAGQPSLFGGGDRAATDVQETVLVGDEFDRRTLLRLEKEVLGQFVTDHPLLEVKDVLAAQTDMELSEVGGLGDGDVVTVAGIVGFVTRKFTKKGEPFAQFRLEDLTGGVIVVAFPNVYERVPELIETDAIVLVKGRADLRGRELQLRALEIREPDLGIERQTRPDHLLVVDVPAASCTPVQVRFLSSRGVTPLDVGTYRVDPNAGVLSELRALLGAEAVKIVPRRDARVVAVPDLVVR